MPRTKKVTTKTQLVRSHRRTYETGENATGQDNPRVMRSDGPADEALDPPVIEPVEGPIDELKKRKLDILRFMEEELTIVLHESTNPDDNDPYPCVCNDGVTQYFIRGEEMQVKRKFVEILARAKQTTYSQKKAKNAAGDDTYIQIPHTSLRYPFAVIHDPSGQKGLDWLKAIQKEG